MSEFTVDVILDMNGYDPDIWGVAETFGWWCLGHNFDVVATIMSMSHLSWEQGFSAGRVIASICEPISGICENPGPVPILENQ